jgi:hypothetical protein
MVARNLLPQRYRATTILISQPSCGGRRPEVCYNSGDHGGPGWTSRGLFLLNRGSFQRHSQPTDFKSLIIHSVVKYRC